MKKGTKKGSGRIKIEQQEMREFFAKYQKLCKEYGYRLVITPAFQARDDSTWSIVLQTSVGRLPRPEVIKQNTVGQQTQKLARMD